MNTRSLSFPEQAQFLSQLCHSGLHKTCHCEGDGSPFQPTPSNVKGDVLQAFEPDYSAKTPSGLFGEVGAYQNVAVFT